MKATVYFTKTHCVVLCPGGHYLTSHATMDGSWGGSMFEATVSEHQAGRETYFDRLAQDCVFHHEEAKQ